MIQLLITIFIIVLTSSTLILAYFKRRFTYWTRRGIKSIPNPTTPFGNVSKLMKQEKSSFDITREFYNSFKSKNIPHGGLFFFIRPVWMPIDKDLIKNVLIKDFDHFMNHGLYLNEKVDILTGNLFFFSDERWKRARASFNDSFTSSKIKSMFQFMLKSCENLEDVVKNIAVNHRESVDMKSYMARFSMDVIGSIAYGLELNTLKDKEGSFNYYGRKAVCFEGIPGLRHLLAYLVPSNWLSAFNFRWSRKDVEEFFLKLVRETLEYRDRNKIERKDLFDVLMQMRSCKNKNSELIDERQKMELNAITGHVFFFFTAAFETTSSAATFALFELSLHEEIQERVRSEIRTILSKYDDQVTYEACEEMIYLDQVILETLRKYPSLASLPRICSKDYKVPNSDVVIEKDTLVMIPVAGLHYDDEIYPEPEKFKPERFESSRRITHSNIFMPFGEGPRICIGMRLGLMETKLALIAVLKEHKVTFDREKTEFPIKFDARYQVTTAQGGIWLNIISA